METTRSLLVSILGLALGVTPASAQEGGADPCAAEVERVCPGARPGTLRATVCLREKEEEVSAECRAKVDADSEWARAMLYQFNRDCRSDMRELCSSVERGAGRMLECLDDHLPELAGSCQAHLTRLSRTRARVEAAKAACTADALRLCVGVPQRAGAIVQCLAARQQELSPGCKLVDPRRALQAAVMLDAVEELTSEERIVESMEILQGLASIAFAKSRVALQVEAFDAALNDFGNGVRMTATAQFVFGDRNQFSFVAQGPMTVFTPNPGMGPASSGLSNPVTAIAWNFATTGNFRHFASLGLQWQLQPVSVPVVLPWSLAPSYAVGTALGRLGTLSAQVGWRRTLGDPAVTGIDLSLLNVDLIASVNFPGRTFVALEPRFAYEFTSRSTIVMAKLAGGIFTDRDKTTSVTAWYQPAWNVGGTLDLWNYSAGLAVGHFFDW